MNGGQYEQVTGNREEGTENSKFQEITLRLNSLAIMALKAILFYRLCVPT